MKEQRISLDMKAEPSPLPQPGPITSKTPSFRRTARWLARQMVPNLTTILVAALLLIGAKAWAEPLLSAPRAEPGPAATTLNYQGRLSDTAGIPLDGAFAMTFALWDAPTGGSLIWGPESHPGVQVTGGLFNTALGSVTAGGIAAGTWNGDRYLEVSVEGETLSPREPIRSVPVAGLALSVPDGAITSRNLAPTLFSAYTSGDTPIDDLIAPTTVLTLTVDFPINATYLILMQVSSRRATPGEITAFLEDENGNPILGSTLHTQHLADGVHTTSVNAIHSFPTGTHTLRLLVGTDDANAAGAVTDAHLIAMPFGQ